MGNYAAAMGAFVLSVRPMVTSQTAAPALQGRSASACWDLGLCGRCAFPTNIDTVGQFVPTGV